MITRRTALFTSLIATSEIVGSRSWADVGQSAVEDHLKELERRSSGRLGVAVLNTATGQTFGNRLDERFALCSTFKALAIAFTLARVDRGEEKLARRIFFDEQNLVMPFKATKPHISDGMTVEELCEAAAIVSDSTAANLLLASFGGPSSLTAYLRSLGDQTTRVDKIEPALNVVMRNQVHDTTSPRAMVCTLQQVLLGAALSPRSRALLTQWMSRSQDAAVRRLRSGLPKGWRIANKPGTWEGISTNDVGVIFPPVRAPMIVAAYLGEAPGSIPEQESVLAEVARIVVDGA